MPPAPSGETIVYTPIRWPGRQRRARRDLSVACHVTSNRGTSRNEFGRAPSCASKVFDLAA